MDSLVEAKREFMYKLCSVMITHMIFSFENLFEEADKMCKGHQPLIQFQKLLREINHWNNSIIKEKTEEIIKDCPMFKKLLNITYVSFIKIMLCVRLTAERRKIKIKPVNPDDFVHECYKKAAEAAYKDPKVFLKNVAPTDREDILTVKFADCIKKVMDQSIPMTDILINLMADDDDQFNFDEQNNQDDVEEEEAPAEPDGVDALPEPEQEPEAPQPQPQFQQQQEPSEVRNIPVNGSSPEAEEDLFPGAAENMDHKNLAPE
jgi:hypothetical protein